MEDRDSFEIDHQVGGAINGCHNLTDVGIGQERSLTDLSVCATFTTERSLAIGARTGATIVAYLPRAFHKHRSRLFAPD